MNVLDSIADQAVAKIDNDDKNADKGAQDVDEDNREDAASAGKPGAGEGGAGADDKGNAAPKYDADGKRIPDSDGGSGQARGDGDKPGKAGDAAAEKEEGEFTADDSLEVEDKKPDQRQPTDQAGIALSPAEQKYIADNIGEPIVLRGIRGEGDNAKEVEIKVYTPGEIPADFKFANDRQMVAAQTAFMNLEQKANRLLGDFRQRQSDAAAQDFERRENEGIRADLADLQKAGEFPKFTKRPGDPGFDDTPQAKQVAEVIGVMKERNESYMRQYQQGRPYKHIGFAEAYDLWKAKNPQAQADKKRDADQDKEDQERKKTAENSKSNRGMSNNNIRKPTVRSGTTIRDILARVDADDSY